jgi:GTPase SAR1 family protein
MNHTEQLHQELRDTTATLSQLLASAADLPCGNESGLAHWQQICDRSANTLADRWFRLAAVGAIKSGKSTLVNALLEGDYLRRGAGVVTSIVTRVRKGETLKAHLFFKSWEAINNEIRQALVLFPDGNGGALDQSGFDLRNADHRAALSQGLASLSRDQLIRTEVRDPNSVLLAAFLRGYPQAASLVDDQERQQAYEASRFKEHQRFAGDDALSVYLRDIQLEIPMNAWNERVEIADCQGSDSPNPHHLAMIQDYLISAHLMIYVISSRTGLRQADMQFLSMLQQMGALDNVLFVINCDLSEHDHLEDLERVVSQTREELLALTPAPQVFAFSALYRLFCLPGTDLSVKDAGRLATWRTDAQMTAHAEAQRTAFERKLQYKLEVEGFSVQAGAHIRRLEIVRNDFSQWLDLSRRLMSRDEAAASQLRDRLEAHQASMQQSLPVLKSALAGAVGEIKNELRSAVDRFFDPHSGEGVKALMAVVSDPKIDLTSYAEALQTHKFADVLYRLLQDYRRRVDGIMAEGLNPALVRVVREAEAKLAGMLAEIGRPHAEMVHQALKAYRQAAGEGADWEDSVPEVVTQVDLAVLRRELKLELPKAQATLDYSLQMKSEAIVQLGVDRLMHWFRRLLPRSAKQTRPQSPAEGARGQRALKVALRRMQKEMATSIRSHLLNQRENIKYQYLLKLADAAGETLYNQLAAHYGMYLADLKEYNYDQRVHHSHNNDLAARLTTLEAGARAVADRLKGLREELDTLSRSYHIIN